MKKILIATTNPGKLAELRSFLEGVPADLVSLKDLRIVADVAETGATFAENAIIKARFYAGKSGLPTLADDGGFEIDALGGEPGAHSHRWVHGDRESTDEELIVYTMERMREVAVGQRGAQLRLVLAFVAGDTVETSEAVIRGIVPTEPSAERTAGFPYRSLLFLPDLGKFYNEDVLTPEENRRFNHRRKAVEALKPRIIAQLAASG